MRLDDFLTEKHHKKKHHRRSSGGGAGYFYGVGGYGAGCGPCPHCAGTGVAGGGESTPNADAGADTGGDAGGGS